jgi:hypothetical protein
MANTPKETPTQADTTKTAEKTEEKVVAKKPAEKIEMTELLGRIVTRILGALEKEDVGERQAELMAARRELRIWYESQSVAERKEVVRHVRKTAENFKQVAEQIHVDIVSLLMQDS